MKKNILLLMTLFLFYVSNVYADQALLISASTYRLGVNEIGDVVGIFPDSWTFTIKEINCFTIVTSVPAQATLELLKPNITIANDKEYWDNSSDGRTYEIKHMPKYKLKYDTGAFSETFSRYPENLTTIKP